MVMPGRILNTGKYTPQNHIQLVKGGAPYFNLLYQLIRAAKHSIHLHVYIFEDDATGNSVANALIEAAGRGVRVYVITDGYASQHLSKFFVRKLRAAGIHFHFFEPLLKSRHFYFGRRMHQKLLVVDANQALVGGINIADRYNDQGDRPAWLDFAVWVQGDAAFQLQKLASGYWKDVPVHPFELGNIFGNSETCSVRVSENDWVKSKYNIWRTYFELFNRARKSITIICSYFLPGRTLRKQLAKAVKRGVRVKIILAGPSDVMVAKYAERYLYNSMLRHGIELYEYQPTVLHAKMAVVDEHWVTIGSYNVNNISAYASMELNLDIRNRPFARQVQQILDGIIMADCVQVVQRDVEKKGNWFNKLIQRSSYEFIRLVTNLSTFYYRPE